MTKLEMITANKFCDNKQCPDYRQTDTNKDIIISFGHSWVKITYAMWRSKTPYDESKHLASIANHIINQPAFILGG